MLERVCSGRRTRFLRLMDATIASTTTTIRMVQRVRAARSVCHSSTAASTKEGRVISSARASTRCSKLNPRLAWRSASLGCDTRSEPILLDAPVEASAAEPEGLCCMANVASVSRERLAYQQRFYFFQAHLFDGFGPISRLQREIFRPDVLARAHKNRALHRVVQLANISWPWIVEQVFQP